MEEERRSGSSEKNDLLTPRQIEICYGQRE